MYGNKLYYCEGVDDPHADRDNIVPADEAGKVNLIGSLVREEKRMFTTDRFHKPALDIDFPCTLLPSTKPDHFHLYIDKELEEAQYKRLIEVMVEVGLVQKGILKRFIKSGQTCLRPPGHKKPEGYDEELKGAESSGPATGDDD